MVIVRIHGPDTPKELAEFTADFPIADLEGLIDNMVGKNEYYRGILFREGRPRTDISILVNGRSCMFLGGLKARLEAGDVVDILLPMIGG